MSRGSRKSFRDSGRVRILAHAWPWASTTLPDRVTSMSEQPGTALFWDLVQPRIEAGDLEEGTIMGRRCVRSEGAFVAMAHSRTGALVVRLAPERVSALVRSGEGEPFAPAGRVFREWVMVPREDEALWTGLLDEALEEVRSR